MAQGSDLKADLKEKDSPRQQDERAEAWPESTNLEENSESDIQFGMAETIEMKKQKIKRKIKKALKAKTERHTPRKKATTQE